MAAFSNLNDISIPNPSSSPSGVAPPSKAFIKGRIPSLKHPSQLVALYVGEDEQVFTVPRDFACHYSPVLKAAFNSKLIKGTTQTYHFENTTPRALRLLNHWFYTQKLDISWEADAFERDSVNTLNAKAAIELWVLIEGLQILTLQNMALEELVLYRKVTNNLPIVYISYIYERTRQNSPLCRFIVDACVHLTTRGFKEYSQHFPQEFLIDLVTIISIHIPVCIKVKIRPKIETFHLYQVPEDQEPLAAVAMGM